MAKALVDLLNIGDSKYVFILRNAEKYLSAVQLVAAVERNFLSAMSTSRKTSCSLFSLTAAHIFRMLLGAYAIPDK